MDRHWLKNYPDGVAHEIDPESFGSLNQLLEDSFKKNATKPFSVCMDRWMTYAQLDALSSALGAWLQNLGLEPGARVAIMLPNVPQFAVTGRTVTSFSRAIVEVRQRTLKPSQSNLDSIAFLQYTGGATGLSKGAVLTHRNIVAAILQAEAWFTPALRRIGNVSKTNNIAALPLYHIFALTLCLVVIRRGAHLTLVPNPRDFGKFIAVLKKRPFHMLPAVNTLFDALLQHPQFKTVDFSSLCVSQAGGMAASEGAARHWLEVTGCPMIEGWGMSETCAIGTNNPVTSTVFSGTIGLPLPSIEVAIKDDDGASPPSARPERSVSGARR